MTIYDIAKEAGVAACTVSRVINNKPGVKLETKLRIQALLEKYNYTPDVGARGLSKHATRMIGILLVDIRVPHHIDSAFVIERRMKEKGYTCIIVGTGPDESEMADYIRIMGERRVEGVILMGSFFMNDTVKQAISQYLTNIPVVMANGYIDLPNVSGIVVDEDKGIEDCVALLAKKGKYKIAFVRDGYSPALEQKQKGYQTGMRRLGVMDEGQWIYQAYEGELTAGYDITRQILAEHPDVEAIIYAVDILAAGGVRAVRDIGRRVPEDVSVIGVDNCIYGEICIPKLTSLDNRMEELSNMASALLGEGLNGAMKGHRVMMHCQIIEREST